MSKNHRTRQLVKALIFERKRANAFQLALGAEVLKVINAKLSDMIAERAKITVTPTEGEPRENQAQN